MGSPAIAVEPAGQKSSKFAWFAVVVLLLAGAAFGAFMLFPQKGRMVVTISGPGNKQIDSVQVFVDGAKRCDTSPCVVDDLDARNYFVKVTAPGYATPEPQQVEVTGGGERVLKLQLAALAGSSGLKVSAEGTGLKLWLDGKEMGPLPQELKDVSPGEHTIRVAGNDRFETYEEKITIEADQTKVIGPLNLKVVRGLAIIEAGANSDGAKMFLVSGSERRPLPELPVKIDINTDKSYRLAATKKGFADFDLPITFEPGNAQKRFVIDLRKQGDDVTEVANLPTSTGATTGRGRTGGTAVPTGGGTTQPTGGGTTSSVATGAGKLNINSIPASNIILDGRPLGKTPKTNVSTSAGAHTVVFVHPEFGRKTVVVTVVAGKSATAMVRFP